MDPATERGRASCRSAGVGQIHRQVAILFLPVGDFRECGFVELHHLQSAGGRPSQKAYLRALGGKAAGLDQHRPCGQHAAPEFLEESLDLTMVLVGAI